MYLSLKPHFLPSVRTVLSLLQYDHVVDSNLTNMCKIMHLSGFMRIYAVDFSYFSEKKLLEETVYMYAYIIVLKGWSLLPDALRPFQDLCMHNNY